MLSFSFDYNHHSDPLQSEAPDNKPATGSDGVPIAPLILDFFSASTFHMIIERNDKFCNSQCCDDLQKQYLGPFQRIPLITVENAVILCKGLFSLQSHYLEGT